MNPNPDQIKAIAGFVEAHGGWDQPTAAIREAMVKAMVKNPVETAPIVPKHYSFADLVGRLDADAAAKLCGMTGLPTLIDQMNAGDATAAARWVGLLALAKIVTPEQGDDMLKIVTATEPDPAWTEEVPWDVGTLGRPADDFDIEAARFAGTA